MWYLAFKQMFSRKKQTFLIFLGIAFGTMVYVVIAGIQLGMREYIAEQLLNNTAHVIISGNERLIEKDQLRTRFFDQGQFVKWVVAPAGKREEARLENPQGWFDRLGGDFNVLSYAPRLSINGIVSQRSFRKSVSLTGIVPHRHIKVTSLEDYMKEGSLLSLSGGGNKVVLGSGVMKEIGADVGENILISTGLGEARPFKVVGKLHLGNEQIDDVMVLAHLSDVQSLNRTPGRVSEISVALTDIELSENMAQKWALYSQDKVQSWQQANAAFMQMIKVQDIVRLVITGAILLVAAFGIYNVLSIMISQKQKEIAILRSIGYAPVKIMQLFLIQGLLLGMAGGSTGLLLGHLSNLLIGSIDLGFEIGKGRSLIISYDITIYTTGFIAAQLAAAVASFIPARSAAKLTPLDIIRANI